MARTSGKVNQGPMFFVVRKFGELLEGVLPRFPTKQACATAIGISPSRFSRLLAGRERPGDSLNVLHCLKLAKATGLSPSDVLRTAGKDKVKIADLIESLYGRDRTKLLSTFEAEVLERLAGLTDADAEMVLQIVDRFRQAETEPATPPTCRARRATARTARIVTAPRASGADC